MRLTRIEPGSAAKICAVLYAVLGFVFALIYVPFLLFLSMIGGEYGMGGLGAGIGFAAIIVFPLLYGFIGLIFGALTAWLYNLIAGWIGGLEIMIEADAA